MIIPFKHTALHIHPLFPGLIFFCLITGKTNVLWTLAALLLHESGHLLALKLLHKMPPKISITPFGGLIDLPENASLSPLKGFLIAFAGPLFSFLGCTTCFFFCSRGLIPLHILLPFFRANLLLMLFNLLPVLPLDGGRMLQSFLSAWIAKNTLNRFLLFLGRIIGFLMIFLSIRSAMQGEYQFSPAFGGTYLLYACTLESRQSLLHYYSSLIGRRRQMAMHPMPVQHMAVPAAFPLNALLPRLKENRYHFFHIIKPDGLECLGDLTEEDFCSLLMENDGLTFAEALGKTKKQRSSA